MNTRIYVVRNKVTGAKLLVEAGSQAAARNHVARDAIEVAIPSQKELVEAMRAGAIIVVAGEPDPAPAPVPAQGSLDIASLPDLNLGKTPDPYLAKLGEAASSGQGSAVGAGPATVAGYAAPYTGKPLVELQRAAMRANQANEAGQKSTAEPIGM